MRIVMSGYYGFDNVGDEAILFSIVRTLRELKPDVEVTVLSNNPSQTAELYDVEAVNRFDLKAVREVIKSSDGLISGGGSLMQDATSIKSIPYYAGIIRMAKWFGKSVFVYAQGVGPVNRMLSKWLLRSTFNKVDQITVRDEDSKALLERMKVAPGVTVVPDPVLGLDGRRFTSEWLADVNVVGPIVTVSVREWQTQVPYLIRIADALDQLARDGYSIVFVPMHGKHDYKTSKETAKMMREKSKIAPYNLSMEEKIALIGESELLVGMRLHALIFAAISHTPFAALSYDPKIDSFASMVDQPVVGHVRQDQWGAEDIVEAARSLHERDLSAYEKRVESLHRDAVHTAEMAVDVFNRN
ncbi:polysaccharide pyruvyl transferase CsaB [Tenuibacillus multivorans]|uniref:Polysaccharide pyruvyl transferase CsaB n=1 Tax=Tenuibacillus multivorans TaxID=237069 RepID=A0A1G9X721_9BACI|nr:polysaccharide pyruvyl transferase CsaB [Tenuibacillus multivorans]GEL78654.1 polysaccharide pyruvyl transferase CsaB [Tenuibacillus multivorans]SDM92296.1 polysaccharide pyruvyl transferase CsaB [Tenuibacillus multivorans]